MPRLGHAGRGMGSQERLDASRVGEAGSEWPGNESTGSASQAGHRREW